MRWLQQLRMRLTMLFQWNRAVAHLDEELNFHVDRETEENIAAGMSPEEARYAALRTFGNPALLRDRACATWSWNSLESVLRDIHFAFRALRRTPGFTAIAIVVMALGIGANVTLFTIVHGVLLTPLPFRDSQRLVMLYESKLHDGDSPGFNLVAGGIYDAWKKENQTFSSLALVRDSRVGLSGLAASSPRSCIAANSPGICCRRWECSQLWAATSCSLKTALLPTERRC